jgi:competence protein ComEC
MIAWLLPAALGGVTLGVLASDPAAAGGSPGLVALLATGAAVTTAAACRAFGARGGVLVLLATTAAAAVITGSLRADAARLPAGAGTVSGLVGRTIDLEGTLLDDPRPRADRQQAVLERLTVREASGPAPVTGRLLVWLPRSVEVAAGDRVTFSARIEEPEDFDGFAYRAYLARQGIGGIARTYGAGVMHGADGPLSAVATVRASLRRGLDALVPEPEAALGAGILLGARASIAPEIQDAFATAGLTHVVAISGWNIAIVIGLIARALDGVRRRRGGRWLVPAFTATAVVGYVLLVGASPSVVRAALMAGALLVGRLAGSRGHAASALMLAALVMLLAAPAVLWDVGFQLSLLATAGLIVFSGPLERAIDRFVRLPGWIREPVALTLAAQLTTLPVIVSSFERVSLVAPLANVLVVPLVPLVMLACAVAAPVGALDGAVHLPVLGDLATWFTGGSAWLGLRVMVVTGSAAASLPGASVPAAVPGWLAFAWYPALAGITGWRSRRVAGPASAVRPLRERSGDRAAGPSGAGDPRTERPGDAGRSRGPRPGRISRCLKVAGSLARRPVGALAGVTLVLAVLTLCTLPDGRLHVDVLDIGQGDAVLVTAPDGATLLVDGGPDPDLTLRRLGEVRPWWRRDITAVLLTHPHEDHVGGLPDVLRRHRVSLVFDAGRAYPNASYARFLDLAAVEPGATLVGARAGMRLTLGRGAFVELLYPSEQDVRGPLPAGDINNASVVAVVRLGGFAALLTGDAEAPVEALLSARDLLQALDVLKVAHHGSNSGTTDAFLDRVAPALALISVGAGNDYGHPSQATLARLASRPGLLVGRTDRDGTLRVESDGVTWRASARTWRIGPRRAVGAADARASARADPATATGTARAGSIGAWPFPPGSMPVASSPRSTFPAGSLSIPRAWPGSRRRRRDSSRGRASRSTSRSSRPPPSCTTLTSRGSARPANATASRRLACSTRWATPSSSHQSPRIR